MTLWERIFGVDWNRLLLAQLGPEGYEGYMDFTFALTWHKSRINIVEIYESDFGTFETARSKRYREHYKELK